MWNNAIQVISVFFYPIPINELPSICHFKGWRRYAYWNFVNLTVYAQKWISSGQKMSFLWKFEKKTPNFHVKIELPTIWTSFHTKNRSEPFSIQKLYENEISVGESPLHPHSVSCIVDPKRYFCALIWNEFEVTD